VLVHQTVRGVALDYSPVGLVTERSRHIETPGLPQATPTARNSNFPRPTKLAELIIALLRTDGGWLGLRR